jgi:nucleoside-diphosphate-sugar epimerase
MTNPRQILVTGADGFVGQTLCETLLHGGYAVRGAVRAPGYKNQGTRTVVVGPMTAETDWMSSLEGIDAIVHLAARTHVTGEVPDGVLAKYRQVNVEATERLARMAAASGVKRLVFMSSIKVNGERTSGHPFTEDDTPLPEDAYGISKWEAEQALDRIAHQTGLEVVVLRSPLVYGPGVKGNFLRLMALVFRGYPLPLASVHNRRSLIYVGNLVDAIIACLELSAAAGKTYLVSDGEDISSPELIRAIASALGIQAKLFPCPVTFLTTGAALLGKSCEVDRLIGSLQVDSSKIRAELGWRPRILLAQGLEQTAQWYLKTVNGES